LEYAGRSVSPSRLLAGVAWSELVLGWFASWHLVLPALLAALEHRPLIVVAGGYDVANIPEIGYGLRTHRAKALIAKRVLESARLVIPFSNSSSREVARMGIATNKIRTVYLGVPDPLVAYPQEPRGSMAITIGDVTQSNLTRKGHRVFASAARLLPSVEFQLIGEWLDDAVKELRASGGSNLQIVGRLDEPELHRHLARASVYVQASQHEGFGLAVAEAMLAGNIAVVSRVGSLPEVVGSTGIFLDDLTPAAVAAGVIAGMQATEAQRRQARDRILTKFSLSQREAGLRDAIHLALEA